MALTIVGFAAARLTFIEYVRPHFASALHAVTKVQLPWETAAASSSSRDINPADWTLGDKVEECRREGLPTTQQRDFGFENGPNGSVTFVGAGSMPEQDS